MARRDAQGPGSRGRSRGPAHPHRSDLAYGGRRSSGFSGMAGSYPGGDDYPGGGHLLGGPGGRPDQGDAARPYGQGRPRGTAGFPVPGGAGGSRRPGGSGGGGYGGGNGGGGGYGGGNGGNGGGPRRSGPGGPGGAGGGRRRLIDYPRYGKQGWKRWIPSWIQVTSVMLLGIGSMAVTAMLVYANVAVPDPAESSLSQTTYVYYDDGKTLIGSWSKVNRTIVPLATIPKPVQNAVLSAEDRTFYTNTGVSVTGLLRAAWKTSSGGSLQGGSTITQQYVKIVLLQDSSRTVTRKAKEFVIALKVSREKTKDQILGDYLNSIYFGRGADGLDAAARAYFGHNAAQLTPSEGAFLAGIINGPNLYEPTDPDGLAAAKQRWTYVADGMVEMQAITPAERAKMTFPTKFAPRRKVDTGSTVDPQNQYMLQMVQAELIDQRQLVVGQTKLETGGYKIVTTFNKAMTEKAVKAVHEKLGPRKSWPKGTQVALVSIDPSSGAVRAIYGGDGVERFRNAVSQDIVQAGSTFKPFALVAGLEGDSEHKYEHKQPDGTPLPDDGGTEPISLHSRFDGKSPQYFNGARVPNFGGSQYGQIDLLKATQNSVNTVYMALNLQVGPAHTRDVAIRAGIPEKTVTRYDNNVLGVDSPHPIDMASAYATFAGEGVYHKPHVVKQVTQPGGGQICCGATPGESRFDKGVIADATYAMQQVVKKGSGSYALGLDRPAAGKTGTTDKNKSAWFVGFTPQLSTAVALYRIGADGGAAVPLDGFKGYSDSQMTGGALPVRVWTEFMSRALKGQPVESLPTPVYGGEDVNPTPTTSSPSATTQPPTSAPTQQPTPTDTATQTPTGPPTTPTEPPNTWTAPTGTRSKTFSLSP